MRWLWGALAVGALSLSGCGSSGAGASSFGTPDDSGTAVTYDATAVNLIPDATTSNDSGLACTPRTCAQAGANCGPVADGCGGLLACGVCGTGESCGGGGTPSVCGGAVTCTPKTCADPSVATLCGQQADGCGGLIPAPCVTCTGTTTCGGGSPGTPNVCGGTAACIPTTATAACVVPGTAKPMNCGVMADGCGALVACGADDGGSCPPGEECGGSGTPNVCGAANVTTLSDGAVVSTDGGVSLCVPFTTTEACTMTDGGSLCGPVSNGCGGTITCPTTCATGDSCGGGGIPSVCGHPACVAIPPTTACANPAGGTYCGPVSNGCGGEIICPTVCATGDTCGGGGVPSMCGHPACTPLTACPTNPANGLPYTCGPWPDGCGSTISCGSCSSPNICGGGGQPSQCGDSVLDAGASCDAGLKCDFPTCPAGTNTTTLTGTIYDPAGNDPLYNVVVYVPNTTPDFPLSHGVPSCDCSSVYSGDPISPTTTATNGTFTLTNVPVPASGQVPLVVQVGKWRRQLIWAGVQTCTTNTTSMSTNSVASLLRLPGAESPSGAVLSSTQTIDELPEIAVSTGGADSMECLLQRIGFAKSEYTTGAGGTGHIHIFTGASADGPSTSAGTHNSAVGPDGGNSVSHTKLWNATADLDPYDIVVLSCEGEETRGNGTSGQLDSADLSNLVSYTTNGGRVFASHFHYAWFNQGTFGGDNLGTWTPNADNPNTGFGTGAYSDPIYDGTDTSQLNATIVTTYADGGVFPRGTAMYQWLGNVTALGTNGAPAHELYISEPRFNVYVPLTSTVAQSWLVPDNAGYTYYDENDNPQTLGNSTQYMSFDTPVGGTGDAGAPYCGRAVYSDLHVGGASGDYPGFESSGTPIAPTNCATGTLSAQEKALEFMLLDLASCPSSDSNLPPVPQPSCTPLTACPPSYTCGEYPNGCGDGGFINCGTCDGGATCIDGQCKACTPLTVCPTGVTCGDVPDGCGGILSCGNCASTSACINGTCSAGCTPATSCPPGITCGVSANGCGGTITCGTGSCAAGLTCGGGGVTGACGAGDADTCNPFTCGGLGLSCGPAGDGCGGTLNCGDCTPPDTCGGGGVLGKCGAPNCTPKTCTQLGANCGPIADGCGNVIQCGSCTGANTCGGGGTVNQCGVPACTPRTCAQAGANCGPVADGCGGTLNCGTCTPPDTCGGGGTVSVCGTGSQK